MRQSGHWFWVLYRTLVSVLFGVCVFRAAHAAKAKEYDRAAYLMAWAIMWWNAAAFGGITIPRVDP